MSTYQLNDNLYLTPTPAGAWYAVSGQDNEPLRRFIINIFKGDRSPPAERASVWYLAATDQIRTSMELLSEAQELALVEGDTTPHEPPAGSVEAVVPALIGALSRDGHALLADEQGFHLAAHGFSPKAAEEIAALSADLAALLARHRQALDEHLFMSADAWAAVDVAGNSSLGTWPLYIGGKRLVLALIGEPHFNQVAFTDLVWLLIKRYGRGDDDDSNRPARPSSLASRLRRAHD